MALGESLASQTLVLSEGIVCPIVLSDRNSLPYQGGGEKDGEERGGPWEGRGCPYTQWYLVVTVSLRKGKTEGKRVRVLGL